MWQPELISMTRPPMTEYRCEPDTDLDVIGMSRPRFATSQPNKPPSSASTWAPGHWTRPEVGRTRWTMRWKPAINAFAITFGDGSPPPKPANEPPETPLAKQTL